MPDEKAQADGYAIMISQKALPLLLALLAGSGVGLGGYSMIQSERVATDPTARADPWTGSDARQQEQEIREDMLRLYSRQAQLVDVMERRLDALESGAAVCADRLARVLALLEGVSR